MKIKFLILISLLLLTAFPAQADSETRELVGKVYSTATKEAVPAATQRRY